MAVYTQLTNEAIAELLERDYAIGRLEFAVGIAQGVENTNYLVAVRDAGGAEVKTILTLYEKRVNPNDLPFFIQLMQHLAARGITCPAPIVRRDGGVLSEVTGKHAALFTFLAGKSRTVLRNPHVAEVGRALAQLHGAVVDFNGTRANMLSLPGWQKIYEKIADGLDTIQPGLKELVGSELTYLGQYWPVDLPTGVIHADLFPDNVFFIDDAVSGVIDFYFACNDFFAYDLAITLNAWCFEPSREFNQTKAKLMLQHYKKIRPLNEAERAAFPTLLRGAALRFLLTRAHDLLHHEKSALVTPKDPLEYASKLRFHQHALPVI